MGLAGPRITSHARLSGRSALLLGHGSGCADPSSPAWALSNPLTSSHICLRFNQRNHRARRSTSHKSRPVPLDGPGMALVVSLGIEATNYSARPQSLRPARRCTLSPLIQSWSPPRLSLGPSSDVSRLPPPIVVLRHQSKHQPTHDKHPQNNQKDNKDHLQTLLRLTFRMRPPPLR